MKSKIKVSLDNLLFGFVHGHYNDHYVFVADFVVDDDDVEDDDDDDEEEEEEDLLFSKNKLYSPSVTKRKKKLFRMETVEIKQNATLKHKTEGRSNKYNM
ncbi:hypothetical protein DPMN_053294 [Dreissena polymorpha]|uniref:Uncharacterized protein n=1 Tax=Dreissena polymorpha TaxID=45954 RepID=A0A9D4HQK6_DREPO|nr:hypothetical protein DPMN_053294 [Dreissena polymorpha]